MKAQVTLEQMKQEALRRMEILKMSKNVIKQFKEENKLNLSESYGLLYWLDEEQQAKVKELEQRAGCVVYHVIRDFTEFGELLSLLLVSKYEQEWKREVADLEKGIAFVYVYNLSAPECSEWGSISIRPSIGGVRRIY